ncbi:MAG: ImmA/IrrE family metallo-endopeptidase [Melioribacteraceae bacterium]
MTVTQNISKLKHLLQLFDLSIDELLNIINQGLKTPITKDEIFAKDINLNYLKRIDKVFNKGLHFYVDPVLPISNNEAGVFFRKQKFNTELNFASKKVVNHFEELKISLSAISKLSGIQTERIIPIYTLDTNPRTIAGEIRKILYPNFSSDLKKFLVALIEKFAEQNILVFEFVEYWNQKEKTNIDGFFIHPNVIVLKRNQSSFRREIFTLIHELAHFLINEEEIEKLDYRNIGSTAPSKIEKWCNDFAFYFLSGDYSSEIDEIKIVNSSNDYKYDEIEEISKSTNISKIAIYTRLLYENKISKNDYKKIQNDFEEKYLAKLRDAERIKNKKKEAGEKMGGSAPQPIKSPLLISTIQSAYYEGILTEYEVCQKLSISSKKFSEFIQ